MPDGIAETSPGASALTAAGVGGAIGLAGTAIGGGTTGSGGGVVGTTGGFGSGVGGGAVLGAGDLAVWPWPGFDVGIGAFESLLVVLAPGWVAVSFVDFFDFSPLATG